MRANLIDALAAVTTSHLNAYPLLTEMEVASVLRISGRAVRTLGITATLIAGERRYRQSDVRRHILEHQEKSWSPRL